MVVIRRICTDASVEQEYQPSACISLACDGFAILEGEEVELHSFDDGGEIVLAQSLKEGELQEVVVHSHFHDCALIYVKLTFNIQR